MFNVFDDGRILSVFVSELGLLSFELKQQINWNFISDKINSS
jgi:hypothetical protein